MHSFKPLAVYYLLTLRWWISKMLRMTSADLSISHSSLHLLFLSWTTGAQNIVLMEEVYSVMNQQDCTFKIFFFHSPSNSREVTLIRMCRYSVPFCLTWWTLKRLYVLDSIRCRAYVMHFLITILYFSDSWGNGVVGNKSSHGVQPFSGMSSCPVVQMGVFPGGEAERCKPFCLSSCLLTLWMSSI